MKQMESLLNEVKIKKIDLLAFYELNWINFFINIYF
jgi:hypothetical protein